MDSLSKYNPRGRFTGRAALYARARPEYPSRAVDFIIDHCQLGKRSVLVDIGSGTGISSRLFACRGMKVKGIEPNEEMRKEARNHGDADCPESPEYLNGTAESTGMPDGSCSCVLAAQSFHWFQGPGALAEFHRILVPAGWVCLITNERDCTDSFTRDYGEVMRTLPDTRLIEGPRARVGDALLSCDLFEAFAMKTFPNKQVLSLDGLLARAFSTSYAPEPESPESFSFAENLRGLFESYESDRRVVMKYLTSVYLARKPGA